MHLTGHKVLLTGGSTGIGYALAGELTARGNQVMICGRDAAKLEEAARRLGVHSCVCDVARDEDLHRLLDTALGELGGLTMLVNNAGIQRNYRWSERPPAEILREIDRELAVNLGAVMKLTALSLPYLTRADSGAVVNVSSGLGFVPKESAPVYCATKAAVHIFTKSLRWQLQSAGTRIGVFEIVPPLVDTEMTRGRGTGKLTPLQLAQESMAAMEADTSEIRAGKTKLLIAMNRLAPSVAERIVRRA